MKSKELDQFYTKSAIAQECYHKTLEFLASHKIPQTYWLEPSAGTGAFYSLLPDNKLGIDLDPKINHVICHDFLTYPLVRNDYLTIGNPPFGKNSSLAIKFFNKCAQHSLLIAFILPKTFKKNSTFKKLDAYFHLAFEFDLPDYSFEFENTDYNVPSVFQIWIKKSHTRPVIPSLTVHPDFIFTTKDNADFAIQRVGAAAGKVKEDFSAYAIASHYFIKCIDNKNNVLNTFKNINWNLVKYNTAGNPSISKSELIELYQKNK